MKKKILVVALFVGFVISVFAQKENIDPFDFQWDRNGGYFEAYTDIKIYDKKDITNTAWFESMKQKSNRDYTATLEYIDYTVPGKPPIIKLGTPCYTFSWAGYYEPLSESMAKQFQELGINVSATEYIVVATFKVYCYSVSNADIVNWAGAYQRSIMASNKKVLSKDDKGTFIHYVENSLQNDTTVKTRISAIRSKFLAPIMINQEAVTL